MAWTTPKTWTVGEVLTAAGLNTHLRDNLNALRFTSLGTGTVNNTAWTSVTVTSIAEDDAQGWVAATNYWTVPYSGWFRVDLTTFWAGASGSGSSGGNVALYDSTGAVIQENICRTESDVLNGGTTCTGLTNAVAGQRIYFQVRNQATGAAGSLTCRCAVRAAG